jgi:aminopeptidase
MLDYKKALDKIATDLVELSAKVLENEKVLLYYDINNLDLLKVVEEKCKNKKCNISHYQRNLEKEVETLLKLNDDEFVKYFDDEKKLLEETDNVIIIRTCENPEILNTLPPEKHKLYTQIKKDIHKRRMDGSVKWTLIYWPTNYEAQKENLSFDEYFDSFICSCNQPWEKIKKAQSFLAGMLNKGKKLELFARDTHVAMSIDGMTFCNSTIKCNYPGSEVFSAPVRDSVNGEIFAPGEYLYDGHLMSDLHIFIHNGRISEKSYAKINDKAFQEILNSSPNSRYFGEIAFGTNPGLSKRFFNGLLNEKVAGSFHMAIGECHTETKDEDGKKINLNNANKNTPVHWDITILMHSQSGGGKVVLDGKVISKNGLFLSPELSILNPKV